jgi:hypothetical protein
MKRFSRPENVRQLCKVEKLSGSYAKWKQGARRKGLLGLAKQAWRPSAGWAKRRSITKPAKGENRYD